MHHRTVPQRPRRMRWFLILGQILQGFQHAPRDPHGNPGETAGISAGAGEPVEWIVDPAFRVDIPAHRVGFRNEKIADGIGVTAGAAQPDHIPGLDPGDLILAEQHGPLDQGAVGILQQRAVRKLNMAMSADPGRVVPATSKTPLAGDFVATGHDFGAALLLKSPGQHAPGVIAPDLSRDLRRDIGRRHRASAGLSHAPCRGRIGRRHRLHDLHECLQPNPEAIQLFRQQRPV